MMNLSHAFRRRAGLVAALCMLPCLASPALAGGFGFGSLWAIVNDAGVQVRASGAVSSARIGTGVYTVTFSRPLDRCVWTTSILGTAPAFVSAARTVAAKPAVLYVYTFAVNGAAANRSFNVVVDCQG